MTQLRTLTLLVAAVLVWSGAATAGDSPRSSGSRVEPLRQWDHDRLDGAVFYEVFVRSFADSDGDGMGDLEGLISRLDYLNDGDPTTTDDLGVTGLWLMPIFVSPSYHGYDVTDYESINPDYGSLDDWAELVAEAEQRGLCIILDLVVNHSSSAHPWFEEAASGPSSQRRDWYVWSRTNPGWGPPWGGSAPTWHLNAIDGHYYYGVFWSGMPDLNFTSAGVRGEVLRLARLWLDRGAAGFRLDAARFLVETGPGPGQADTPQTHAFWRELSQTVRAHAPTALLVGENWDNSATIASYYGSVDQVMGGNELPLNFNFPLAASVLQGVGEGDSTPILDVLETMASLYPAGVRDAPFLTNHDQQRVASELCCPAALRAAASVLLTLPGVPFLYYGEEIGLANGTTSGDESKRTPMPWNGSPTGGFTTGQPWFALAPGHETVNVAAQTDDPQSLLSHYRSLIRVRQASPALGAGELVAVADAAQHRSVLAFERVHADERVLVLVNLSGGLQIVGSLRVQGTPTAELYADGNPSPLSGAPGSRTIAMQPYSTAIWRFGE